MKKSKEELYKWFFKKFNSCHLVEHSDKKEKIYMYYDEQFIRQKKMARILDEEIVYPSKPKGKVLFEQDWKNERMWCDYDEIWSYFKTNYSDNHQEIKDLIGWMLKEHDKLSVLTPTQRIVINNSLLKEHDKLSVLTPVVPEWFEATMLKEHDKLSVLTPTRTWFILSSSLKEHDKLSVLTPKQVIFNQY